MRNKVRVYRMPSGDVALVSPAWNDRINKFNPENETEQQFYERCVTAKIPAGWVSLGDVARSALPKTRIARNKWDFQNGSVVVKP